MVILSWTVLCSAVWFEPPPRRDVVVADNTDMPAVAPDPANVANAYDACGVGVNDDGVQPTATRPIDASHRRQL